MFIFYEIFFENSNNNKVSKSERKKLKILIKLFLL